MKIRILDTNALAAISPSALAAYVRDEGWEKAKAYGKHSDIYVRENRPELVLPRTDQLVDYVSVVSRLIGILSEVNEQDELAIYRALIGADQDVVRVRTIISEDNGTIPINKGVEMVAQAREMLLAAACAVKMQKFMYRTGANRGAVEYMKQVKLGQTEYGSFVVTMIAPVLPIHHPMSNPFWTNSSDEPYGRQITRRLADALKASRDAASKVRSGDEISAFNRAVSAGVSANLCDALAKLLDGSDGLEVSVSWTKIQPGPEHRRSIRFSESDADIFKEAARTFRAREPRPDVKLFGTVHILNRGEREAEGEVTFQLTIDKKKRSVRAMLDERSYSVAIRAHQTHGKVVVTGDLEQIEQRWHMANAAVHEHLSDDDEAEAE